MHQTLANTPQQQNSRRVFIFPLTFYLNLLFRKNLKIKTNLLHILYAYIDTGTIV